MKCPKCEYEHGYSNEQNNNIDGAKGDFWEQPVPLERGSSWNIERKRLYACPSCGVAFINVDAI